MKNLVSPPVVYSAIGLYLMGIGHEIGIAYGLPTDEPKDHTAPVVLVAASTATGTVGGGVGFLGGINAISGDDIKTAPPERWKVTKSI